MSFTLVVLLTSIKSERSPATGFKMSARAYPPLKAKTASYNGQRCLTACFDAARISSKSSIPLANSIPSGNNCFDSSPTSWPWSKTACCWVSGPGISVFGIMGVPEELVALEAPQVFRFWDKPFDLLDLRMAGRIHQNDGHALGEVARLIDVATAGDGDVVSEQLQRDDGQQREQGLQGLRQINHVPHFGSDLRVVFCGQGDDRTFARLDLLQVAERFFVERAGGNHDDRRGLLINHRDGAVFHFRGRIAFGVDVRNLLHLERAFE